MKCQLAASRALIAGSDDTNGAMGIGVGRTKGRLLEVSVLRAAGLVEGNGACLRFLRLPTSPCEPPGPTWVEFAFTGS